MAANIDPNSAVYATDEYGRPFIIVREGQQKSRLSGIAAIRVSENPLKKDDEKVNFFLCHVVSYSCCKDCFQHHQDISWSSW